MASEATDDEAKPPTLVCAPCWICLEDGPDDNGEPLVRDCACRGETSAGYHVSCIIDYAKVKTNQAIDLREKKQKVVDTVHDPWKFCPNCQQPYMGVVSLQLADAWLEHTKHLPESHYVRWMAHGLLLDTLLFQATLSKDYQSIEILAKAMLQTLEENPSELAVSFFGGTSAGDYHTKTLVAGESVKPLAALGMIKENTGDVESAAILFKRGLEYLDVAEASGYWCAGSAQRDFIEGQLRDIKREMGLISPSEEVAELRENLSRLIQNKENGITIARAKQNLAAALKKTDPPQYFEAIKLLKEGSVLSTQVFGPDHDMSVMSKHLCDKTRKEYMLYLQDIAKKGDKKS